MPIQWGTPTERDFFLARLLAKQEPSGLNASEREWDETARIMRLMGYEDAVGERLRQRWSRGVWAKSKAQFPGTFAENGANIRVYVDAPTSTCGRKRKAAEANGAATESTATSAVGAIKKTDSTAAPTITVSDDDATSAESEGEEKPEEEKKKDATLPANGSLTIDHYFKPLGSADKAKNEKCKVKRIRFI